MSTTSESLLEQLRRPNNDEAWQRFVNLYTPLLFEWAGRFQLQEDDAADVVQEVLLNLFNKLPTFQYDPNQRFRGWLWTILRNKCHDFHRRKAKQPVHFDPSKSELVDGQPDADAPEEREFREHLLARALQLMQTEFSPNLWNACIEHVGKGRSAAEVAADLGISPGTVYVAKSRIMSRLRQELEGMVD